MGLMRKIDKKRDPVVRFGSNPYDELVGDVPPLEALRAGWNEARRQFTPHIMMLAPPQEGYGDPSQPIATGPGITLQQAARQIPMGPAAMASIYDAWDPHEMGYYDAGIRHGLEPLSAPRRGIRTRR